MADDLTTSIDQADFGDAERAHNNSVAIIIAAIGRRPAGKARVGTLHDDDFARRNAGFEQSPLFDEVAGSNNGKDWTVSESEALPVAIRICRVSDVLSRRKPSSPRQSNQKPIQCMC